MSLKLPSRLFLAAALVAAQPVFAAKPPHVSIEELMRETPRSVPPEEDPERPPAVHPYNEDYARALETDAVNLYAGMPVVGVKITDFIGDQVSEGSLVSMMFNDWLVNTHPGVHEGLERSIGLEKMYEAYDRLLAGFRDHPNAPQRVQRMVCFVSDPALNGYYSASETIDRLVTAHKCNPKYAGYKLHRHHRLNFQPQALSDALSIARNVAKISEDQIDNYLVDLMGDRHTELQHALLVTYVDRLGVRDARKKQALYQTLNNRLTRLHAEMNGKSDERQLEIIRREFLKGKGIEAYFAGVFVKALVALNISAAGPYIRDLDTAAPLSNFVNKADIPGHPAARIAPPR